jgi:hypothetical protein
VAIDASRGHYLVCRQALGTRVLRRLHTWLLHSTWIELEVNVNCKQFSTTQRVIIGVNSVSATPSSIVMPHDTQNITIAKVERNGRTIFFAIKYIYFCKILTHF